MNAAIACNMIGNIDAHQTLLFYRILQKLHFQHAARSTTLNHGHTEVSQQYQ